MGTDKKVTVFFFSVYSVYSVVYSLFADRGINSVGFNGALHL
jgi:hypothetical protein